LNIGSLTILAMTFPVKNSNDTLDVSHASDTGGKKDVNTASINDTGGSLHAANALGENEVTKIPATQGATLPKKGRTAYFIFMGEKREEVQAKNGTKSIASTSKIIGRMWKELSIEEIDKYKELSRIEKEEYKKQMGAYKKRFGEESTSDSTKSWRNHAQNGQAETVLPVARVRQICRLNPEVKISKEAVLLVTKTADFFTSKLAIESNLMAHMQKRQKLTVQDIVDVASLKEPFFFLRDDLHDLMKQQRKISEDGHNRGVGAKAKDSSKLSTASLNNRKMTSFFQAK